jgi:diketogulonate reductase-like aldo/keto reductase
MLYKKFGNTGREVSSIGVGTWSLDGPRKQNIETIRYAIDNGVNFIDTAEMYKTEDLVGEAIRGYDREKLFIATKVWPTHFSYDDVIKACNSSLERLNLKYVDLYQLHWPSDSIEINETMKAMEKLVDEGKVMNIGISNFSVKQTESACNALEKYAVVSNQVEYNVISRKIENDGVYDYCISNNMAIIAYSPLAHGEVFRNNKALEILNGIGRKYGKTASQISINWLIQRGAFPIPKASNIAHMRENISASDFTLKAEDMDLLQAI